MLPTDQLLTRTHAHAVELISVPGLTFFYDFSEGHEMLALYYSIIANQLSPSDVKEFAYHVHRSNVLPVSQSGRSVKHEVERYGSLSWPTPRLRLSQ